MKGIRNQKASRWSRQSEHNEYGIYNWLRDKGFVSGELQLEICGAYAFEAGFKWTRGEGHKVKKRKMVAFIQNRFNDFCQYALNEWYMYKSK